MDPSITVHGPRCLERRLTALAPRSDGAPVSACLLEGGVEGISLSAAGWCITFRTGSVYGVGGVAWGGMQGRRSARWRRRHGAPRLLAREGQAEARPPTVREHGAGLAMAGRRAAGGRRAPASVGVGLGAQRQPQSHPDQAPAAPKQMLLSVIRERFWLFPLCIVKPRLLLLLLLEFRLWLASSPKHSRSRRYLPASCAPAFVLASNMPCVGAACQRKREPPRTTTLPTPKSSTRQKEQ